MQNDFFKLKIENLNLRKENKKLILNLETTNKITSELMKCNTIEDLKNDKNIITEKDKKIKKLNNEIIIIKEEIIKYINDIQSLKENDYNLNIYIKEKNEELFINENKLKDTIMINNELKNKINELENDITSLKNKLNNHVENDNFNNEIYLFKSKIRDLENEIKNKENNYLNKITNLENCYNNKKENYLLEINNLQEENNKYNLKIKEINNNLYDDLNRKIEILEINNKDNCDILVRQFKEKEEYYKNKIENINITDYENKIDELVLIIENNKIEINKIKLEKDKIIYNYKEKLLNYESKCNNYINKSDISYNINILNIENKLKTKKINNKSKYNKEKIINNKSSDRLNSIENIQNRTKKSFKNDIENKILKKNDFKNCFNEIDINKDNLSYNNNMNSSNDEEIKENNNNIVIINNQDEELSLLNKSDNNYNSNKLKIKENLIFEKSINNEFDDNISEDLLNIDDDKSNNNNKKGILIDLVENNSIAIKKNIILKRLETKRKHDEIKIKEARKIKYINNKSVNKKNHTIDSISIPNKSRTPNKFFPTKINNKFTNIKVKNSFGKLSNKKNIINSINQVILAGLMHKNIRESIIKIIDSSKKENFIIVLKQIGRYDLKGLYYYKNENELEILYGRSKLPHIINNNMIDIFFKYNSNTKNFNKIENNRKLSLTVDAIILKYKYLK